MHVAVIIPARDEGAAIARLVGEVHAQSPAGITLEVVVVDNGSSDDTGARARAAGAAVLDLPLRDGLGNPAAARNLAARQTVADLLVFLDADCRPDAGWLEAVLHAHRQGYAVVGGPLELPRGLPFSARLDYYCGWYHVHAGRRRGEVVSHPPGNLAVARALFLATSGFTEEGPAAYAHEELRWQAEARAAGHPILFEPAAVVRHYNRPGVSNLLRRNYRWGYSAIESKARTGAARMAWLYRYPKLLIAASAPMAVAQTLYIVGCWTVQGRLEPLLTLPWVLLARCAYCAGAAVGTLRWLRRQRSGAAGIRPAWE